MLNIIMAIYRENLYARFIETKRGQGPVSTRLLHVWLTEKLSEGRRSKQMDVELCFIQLPSHIIILREN